MKCNIEFKMNEKLYLKNPEESDLGKRIVSESIELIHEVGFEKFNFKKLSKVIGTTEAGVYRYFRNKHKLLIYLTNCYWSWLGYEIEASNLKLENPLEKLKKIINSICSTASSSMVVGSNQIDEVKLRSIMVKEGTKAYLTQSVSEDNKDKLFKPYKDLCISIAEVIRSCDSSYKFPRSLASGLVEMAHFQSFFKSHLPALTDFEKEKPDNADIAEFLETMAFSKLNVS